MMMIIEQLGAEESTKGYLPLGIYMADVVTSHMRSGMGLTAGQAAEWADTEIPREQRFYDLEFHHASAILGPRFPFVRHDMWLIHLKNKMGWRLVTPKPCKPGEVRDEMSRACVSVEQEKPIPTTTIPWTEPIPTTTAVQEQKAAGLSMTWPLIALVAVGLILFSRK